METICANYVGSLAFLGSLYLKNEQLLELNAKITPLKLLHCVTLED